MIRRHRRIILLLILLAGFSVTGYTQRTFGVRWDVPEHYEEALRQLHRFDNLGITHIQVSEPLAADLQKHIRSDSLRLYLAISRKFLLPDPNFRSDTSYQESLESLFSHYRTYPHIQGIGLFEYGAVYSPELSRMLRPYVLAIHSQLDLPVYFITAQPPSSPLTHLFDRIHYHYTGQTETNWKAFDAYIFDGEVFGQPYEQLSYLLQQTKPFPSRPVFFDGSWLLQSTRERPDFARYIRRTANGSIAIYPFEEADHSDTGYDKFHNWLVLLLLIIWILFGVHFSFNPLYRRNIKRYFLTHDFFLQDLLERRIRMPYTALILFFIHILVGGLWMYAVADHFYTPLGLEALLYHFPGWASIIRGPGSFLLLGLGGMFLIQGFSVLLLHIFSGKRHHLFQTILLYSWPLQLNLLTVSILIPLINTAIGSAMLTIFTGLFLIICITSHLLAVRDIARNMVTHRYLYVISTIGLYGLLLIGGGMYLFIYTNIPQILRLAASFS